MVKLPFTLDDTVGPYFPPLFAATSVLDLWRPNPGLNVGPRGDPVVLRIRLLDIDGHLAHATLLETWQANSNGELRVPGNVDALADDPFFEGYGRSYSATGEFEIRTVMPGCMKSELGTRAPFVTLTIFSDGISRIATQIFFEGHPANDWDEVLSMLPPVLRQRLIARRHDDGGATPVYALDIKMRGEDETPFFDDLAG